MSVTAQYLEIYQDLKEHCDNCVGRQIGSNQPAARSMDLRNRGYDFQKYGNKYERRVFCESCNKSTPHRILLNKEPVRQARSRFSWSAKFVKRVKTVLKNYDPIERRNLNPAQLEIDHKTPFIRFKHIETEVINEATITDDEIASKYMLLTRSNNLLKSRACERCDSTGVRQPSQAGVEYFYKGTKKYKGTCEGCFWYDPAQWTDSLNDLLAK